jgi:23S rRNA (guanosine2251-2'-O)-methyltransferase
MTGSGGGAERSGKGGRTKSGKPRPGTGGYGKKRLEGKGPTPPAHMRPGHPAQRRAAAQAARPATGGRAGGTARGTRGRSMEEVSPERARGAGDAPEVVAGRNPVLESLRARVPASALYAGPRLDSDQRVTDAIRLAADAGIPLIEAGRPELDRLTGGAVHQGLALKIRPYNYAHPADPRNLGAIVRSVAAFGGHGVLVPARRSASVSAGAWKASAGALARVPVARAPNLAQALASYQEQGLFVAGLDAHGETPLGELDLAEGPLVLVVGSEGRGLSRLIAQRCDVLARIPIAAQAESLNAGVAAGVALYAVAGRRAG